MNGYTESPYYKHNTLRVETIAGDFIHIGEEYFERQIEAVAFAKILLRSNDDYKDVGIYKKDGWIKTVTR